MLSRSCAPFGLLPYLLNFLGGGGVAGGEAARNTPHFPRLFEKILLPMKRPAVSGPQAFGYRQTLVLEYDDEPEYYQGYQHNPQHKEGENGRKYSQNGLPRVEATCYRGRLHVDNDAPDRPDERE